MAGSEATNWICETCGVQYAATALPPNRCAVCQDERQYVPETGQRWTTLDTLRAAGYRNSFEELEPGLVSIATEPEFAIGQQALLVQAAGGNLLWDCVTYLDAASIGRIQDLGGISTIAISHPHFYGSCVDWAHEFEATILLPSVDHEFVMRPDPAIRFFDEDTIDPVPGISLVRVGGHFRGSTVLLWPAGAGGRGTQLTGDSLALVADPAAVTVMYSYPNRIPLSADEVRDVAARVLPLEFDRMYDGWRGDVMRTGARQAVERSLDRYVAMLERTWPRG